MLKSPLPSTAASCRSPPLHTSKKMGHPGTRSQNPSDLTMFSCPSWGRLVAFCRWEKHEVFHGRRLGRLMINWTDAAENSGNRGDAVRELQRHQQIHGTCTSTARAFGSGVVSRMFHMNSEKLQLARALSGLYHHEKTDCNMLVEDLGNHDDFPCANSPRRGQ